MALNVSIGLRMEEENIIWMNPLCATKAVNSVLLNGRPLYVKTSARVPYMAKTSARRVVTVGALSNLTSMRKGYLLSNH